MTDMTRSGALRTDRALLVLEDGTVYRGYGYGATGASLGEAVFSTGMTGYQETLTDPSYAGQIVVQTAPHIGNTGVNTTDAESRKIWVAGYVVRDAARVASNWRSERTLDEELIEQGIVGIQGIDTRALTRRLRSSGSMRAGVFSGEHAERPEAELLEEVRASEPMAGRKLADSVSVDTAYTVEPHQFNWFAPPVATIVALDLGIKSMTPQRFAERGVRVHVLPASATLEDIYSHTPTACSSPTAPVTRQPLTSRLSYCRACCVGTPFFGICFGNQLLGRALGFGTYKLPFGHRGINQPVMDKTTGKVEITAQNHGFAVDAPIGDYVTAPNAEFGQVMVSHVGLNDNVVEGLTCKDIPAFSVQYHPEAAAGPHDSAYLFDRFIDLMVATKTAKEA